MQRPFCSGPDHLGHKSGPGTLIRMWLYAAGLLLMDAVLKLNDEASPITVSSMYGLILNVVKVRVPRTSSNRWSAT